MYGYPVDRRDTEHEAWEVANKLNSTSNQLVRIGRNTIALSMISPTLGTLNLLRRLYAGGLDDYYVTRGQGSMWYDKREEKLVSRDNFYVQMESPTENSIDALSGIMMGSIGISSGLGINHLLGADSSLEYIFNPVIVDVVTKGSDLVSRLF